MITFLLSLNKTSWKVSYTFIYICIKQINYVHVLPISNISISAMGNTQSCIRSKSLNNSEIHPLNIINSIQNIVINYRLQYMSIFYYFGQTHNFTTKINQWQKPGVPTAIWHFFSFCLSSTTGIPPMKVWHLREGIHCPIELITSKICVAISLVGANTSTYRVGSNFCLTLLT